MNAAVFPEKKKQIGRFALESFREKAHTPSLHTKVP